MNINQVKKCWSWDVSREEEEEEEEEGED